MNVSFNAAYEAWLPVRLTDGSRDLKSLQACLLEAHEIREVSTDSPLQTAGLNRLLLALALRIFPDTAQRHGWWEYWRARRFPEKAITAYFQRWKERFEVFHETHPFMQHPRPLAEKKSPVTRLFHEYASGNNPTLFDHSVESPPPRFPVTHVLRGLIATQAAALGGGKSKPFNLSHAPLAQGGVFFWIRGCNLFEALLLNAPPLSRARIPETDEFQEDVPLWERDPPDPSTFNPRGRQPLGYLDYLTFLSRMVLLDKACHIQWTHYNQGDKLVDDIQDPLMAYKARKEKGWSPFRFKEDRMLWQDVHVLLGLKSGDVSPPRPFEWLANQTDELERKRWEIDAFGMVTDQAKINLWRHERFPLHVQYLQDPQLEERLNRHVTAASDQYKNLRNAFEVTAKSLCGSESRTPEVQGLREHFLHLASFWPRLEESFYRHMTDLVQAWGDGAQVEQVENEWGKTLFRTAISSFEDVTRTLIETARQLKARELGRQTLRKMF